MKKRATNESEAQLEMARQILIILLILLKTAL